MLCPGAEKSLPCDRLQEIPVWGSLPRLSLIQEHSWSVQASQHEQLDENVKVIGTDAIPT
jgi:hypothetical protein